MPVTLDRRMHCRLRPTAQRQVMVQRWRHLLFLHWRVEPEVVQRTLPPALTVDTFDGAAWLGVVPFLMRGIRPVYAPPVPGVSDFLEMNLRTYAVAADGMPGVWFYSLDANQWLAVKVARTTFRLPYFHARMAAGRTAEGTVTYRCHRRGMPESAASAFRWTPVGVPYAAEPGTLDFFLAERYLLFADKGGRIFSGQVHHPPYPLRHAAVDRWSAAALPLAGFDVPGRPPDHTVCSDGVDVAVYPIRPVVPEPGVS